MKKKKNKSRVIKSRKIDLLRLKNVKKSKVFNTSIFFDLRRLSTLYKCYFYVEVVTKKFKEKSLVVCNLADVFKKSGFYKMHMLYTHKYQGFFIKKLLKWNNACKTNIYINNDCDLKNFSEINNSLNKMLVKFNYKNSLTFLCKNIIDLL